MSMHFRNLFVADGHTFVSFYVHATDDNAVDGFAVDVVFFMITGMSYTILSNTTRICMFVLP